MRAIAYVLCVTALAAPGCALDDDGEIEDGCALPAYGDGRCDLDLACAEPDIDCFRLFDSQSEADAWFNDEFEPVLAAEQGREPRALVPADDPRVARMQELLEQGWEAYRAVTPVGDLARRIPALLVPQDPVINAQALPDPTTGNGAFAVVVFSGLLDADASADETLALVMHELEHVVALHATIDPFNKNRLRRYYAAGDVEPLGFEQADDPAVAALGDLWRALGGEVGPFTQEALGGLPLGAGEIAQIFRAPLASRAEQPECAGPLAQVGSLTAEIGSHFSELRLGLVLPEDPTLRPRVDAAMAALRDECLADFPAGFFDVVAALVGVTADELRAAATPEDLALVDNKHFIDAIGDLVLSRRSAMRAVEQQFEAEQGQPWENLRYFSFEEAADDATVPVMDAAGLQPDALGGFLKLVLSDDTRAECQALLDAGVVPPYGDDLLDEHHATCWRIAHVAQLVEAGQGDAAAARAARAAGAARAARAARPRGGRVGPARRWLSPRLSDHVVSF